MGTSENKQSDFVDLLKSWIPRKSEPVNVTKDFWMPDHSCRVCYECDAQFTLFNRRHHCRLCGRVFCAKCTTNSIPAPSDEPNTGREDWDRIRVCNFCFKQWQQGTVANDNGNSVAGSGLSPSPSATSLVSTKSSGTCNSGSSTVGSTPYTTGPYEHVPYSSGRSPRKCPQLDSTAGEQHDAASGRSTNPSADALYTSQNEFGYYIHSTRSDDDDYEYGTYHSDSEARNLSHADEYYGPLANGDIDSMFGPHKMHHGGEHVDAKSIICSPIADAQVTYRIENAGEDAERHYSDGCEAPPYDVERTNAELVDFESNGLLWLPPDPENEEDEKEAFLLDDEDCDDGTSGEWGYLRSSNSFDSKEYRSRDKSNEEHRKAMKNVVEGHFRALVAQLLQVENLQVSDENDTESWLEIITSLSWEAATLLKPDTSQGGGMDPGGYVKVKCIACGRRSESLVVKGVVCKKNVAHRRMMSKIDKPRFLILGGALEYHRVSNLLSSVDTLLQQEMDHLKMAVARIAAHHPNVLLVEKSVSRYAQEYLLAKDISLVLNIKRPLLERIARCTGAQIVPSIDHLTSQKLGYCDLFRVEKFLENHGSAGQSGKQFTKTLMFFEGCPKPLGCTILLKGANGDELKKVKHVVQYGVFAAYHLALETSFLVDEGASLPELPLKSPITVALPDKPSSIGRSISTIPGFSVPGIGNSSVSQPISEKAQSDIGTAGLQTSNKSITSGRQLSTKLNPACNFESTNLTSLSGGPSCQTGFVKPPTSLIEPPGSLTSLSYSGQHDSCPCRSNLSSNYVSSKDDNMDTESNFLGKEPKKTGFDGHNLSTSFGTFAALEHSNDADGDDFGAKHWATPEVSSLKQDGNVHEEIGSSKEEFPPSPSDHQSILVSLSMRCVWKGTVCERAHLLRIKYYGNFDKPLGRFLQDRLFDQSHRCHSCQMPPEGHVHCYTHRQGSLTISVKKLPEIILPGEREGKIWMWHRCLRCPRTNGFPPATQRVVMSDAAWALSFGKFLELSFSNHAAASRVASCGHSLHRDCLRFYGFGRMVACFRYASIDVYSVYLPPSKVEFNCDNQGWIQEEANEVHHMAELLFNEVQSALHCISEKMSCTGSQDADTKVTELSRLHIAELEGLLQKEKGEYEGSLQKMLSREVKVSQPDIDILEINKLRLQLLFHSYVWDQRLIYVASLSSTSLQDCQKSFIPKLKETRVKSVEKLVEMDTTSRPSKGFSSCDSYLQEKKSEINPNQEGNDAHASQPGGVHKGRDKDQDLNPRKETEHYLSSSANIDQTIDPLESGKIVRRAQSEGEFPTMASASTTSKKNNFSLSESTLVNEDAADLDLKNCVVDKAGAEVVYPLGSALDPRLSHNAEKSAGVALMPFPDVYTSVTWSSLLNFQQNGFSEYSPAYISLFREFKRQSGAKLILPVGVSDTIVPVFDDEPTSIIACALVSSEYHVQMSELEKGDSSVSSSLLDSVNLLSLNSLESDLLYYTKDFHARVFLADDDPLGKVKYTVTCYYAKRFEALRRSCCPSELDFIRSLSRCKKWGAQGGKSNVFFAKTLDDRFIIKQVTKTELESFIKFGPAYFKYLSESINTIGGPTCLAKILGIYQVSSKHLKGGKESKMDVLVMENLLFRRNVTRLYDLKGSSRSRYNPDTSGSNKVLLDQNLIEAMPTSPIFVGNKAKRLLERAVWNDTSFLASVDVMDYSLLVGVDEEKHELVLGIIDFMRQYTWDKHLETWVKISGILGGSRNTTPTVISPQQYKKRFRKAMTAYFLMVPDQWSPPQIIASGSQSDLGEETLTAGPP